VFALDRHAACAAKQHDCGTSAGVFMLLYLDLAYDEARREGGSNRCTISKPRCATAP
jgi:N-acetyl-beta-hexosaminidase